MLDTVETFLKTKILNKDKNWWAKVLGGLAAVGLFIFALVRYSFLKDKLTKAELENILVSDDQADAVAKAKQQAIEKARAEALAEANKHEAAAQKAEVALKKIEKQSKSDQDVINKIDSWDELDKTIKDK